jgi:hypothetical protein
MKPIGDVVKSCFIMAVSDQYYNQTLNFSNSVASAARAVRLVQFSRQVPLSPRTVSLHRIRGSGSPSRFRRWIPISRTLTGMCTMRTSNKERQDHAAV